MLTVEAKKWGSTSCEKQRDCFILISLSLFLSSCLLRSHLFSMKYRHFSVIMWFFVVNPALHHLCLTQTHNVLVNEMWARLLCVSLKKERHC